MAVATPSFTVSEVQDGLQLLANWAATHRGVSTAAALPSTSGDAH